MRGYKKGFTLIEILLVTAILSIIALAVYTTFNNGIRLWERMSRDVLQEDINIFFSKISDDLRNSFRYTGIEFFGAEDSIAFAVPVKIRVQGEPGGVARARYSFNERANAINRVQTNYSRLYLAKSGPIHQLVGNVRFLKFQYYCYDQLTETYFWVDAWNEEQVPLEVNTNERLPLAVKIEVGADANEGGKFTKIVTIPVGR